MSRKVAHAIGVSSGLLVGYATTKVAHGLLARQVLAEENVEPPKYPWSHLGWLSSYDHARYPSPCPAPTTSLFIATAGL